MPLLCVCIYLCFLVTVSNFEADWVSTSREVDMMCSLPSIALQFKALLCCIGMLCSAAEGWATFCECLACLYNIPSNE